MLDSVKVIRYFNMNFPGWGYFIEHLNYAHNSNNEMLRVFHDYYFVAEVFDEDVPKTNHAYKHAYDQLNSMHPNGIQERPVFLISFFDGIKNLGKHIDPVDQFHWNCVGRSLWEIDMPDGTIRTEVLNPGDMIAIPVGTYHSVKSLTPRAGITFSSNRLQ